MSNEVTEDSAKKKADAERMAKVRAAKGQKEAAVATADPLQQAIIRAKLAQQEAAERRKDSPDVTVNPRLRTVPMKKKLETLARRDSQGRCGQDEEMHYTVLDRDMADTYPDEGYEPVLKPGGGQESFAGDPIFRIPMADYKEMIQRPADIDKARMKRKSPEETAAENAGMADITRRSAKQNTPEAAKLLQEIDG
jgi:hypothetical protein